MSKEINGVTWYKIGYVSKQVERIPATIKNWYSWAEIEDRLNDLPEVRTNIGRKGTRYFTQEGINQLIKFRDEIVVGEMAEYNREKWGERGKRIILEKSKEIEDK